MPPAVPPHNTGNLAKLARRALVTAGPAVASQASHRFERRGLSVNHTQGVTLGVIAAYVVVIALLWNLPYVRWVLWPFKVCSLTSHFAKMLHAPAVIENDLVIVVFLGYKSQGAEDFMTN
jgi:hypothetical protein